MRTETIRQVAVIDEQSGKGFERAFNEKMKELARFKVDIDRANTREFLAYIFYEETVTIPENAKEEYKLRGEVYHCADCPMIQWGEGRNHSCPRSKMVHDDTPACSYFYEALKEGRFEVER